MNTSDEYWLWSMKAITEPNSSNNFYYYDKLKDQLFGLSSEGDDLFPIFRNVLSLKGTNVINSLFKEAISNIKSQQPNIILLEKLSFNSKIEFFKKFISGLEETPIKDKLLLDLENFSPKDKFDFKYDLKNEDRSLYFDFDMERGAFIAKNVEELYHPLGISEESKIIW